MKLVFLLATLASTPFLVRASESDEDESAIVELTGVNFASWLKINPIALVMFYSPKSVESKKLLPEYDELASVANELFAGAVLAKIDCTSDSSKEACRPYVDGGIPTIKLFRDGHVWSRSRDRRRDGSLAKDDPLMNAVSDLTALTMTGGQKEQSPSGVIDLTAVDFAAWIKSHSDALVMFYSPEIANCMKLMPDYDLLVDVFMQSAPDAVLAKIDCTADEAEEICDEYVDSGYPSFTVFRDGQPWEIDYNHRETALKMLWEGMARGNRFTYLSTAEFAAPMRKAVGTLMDLNANRMLKKKSEEL